MEKNLYIDASHLDETRIVLKSENHIEEYEYENRNKLHLKNNIYLGKVSRIEASLQAAFVNYGKQRHGFLAFNDIQSDYYQIPHDDKNKLKKVKSIFLKSGNEKYFSRIFNYILKQILKVDEIYFLFLCNQRTYLCLNKKVKEAQHLLG